MINRDIKRDGKVVASLEINDQGYLEECTEITGEGFRLTAEDLSGVTTIGVGAFINCSGLTEIDISNSVTTIGLGAFYSCSGLREITIPNSVKTIEEGAFADCSGLTKVAIPNSVKTIGEGAFYSCSGLREITIPNGVTTIESFTFSGCLGLTKVAIPNSVTTIGVEAFKGCRKLEEITIPNSVTTIGAGAFIESSSPAAATEFVFPNGVTRGWRFVAYACTGLTSVTILSSLRDVGSNVFGLNVNFIKVVETDIAKKAEFMEMLYNSYRDNTEVVSDALIRGELAQQMYSLGGGVEIGDKPLAIPEETAKKIQFEYEASGIDGVPDELLFKIPYERGVIDLGRDEGSDDKRRYQLLPVDGIEGRYELVLDYYEEVSVLKAGNMTPEIANLCDEAEGDRVHIQHKLIPRFWHDGRIIVEYSPMQPYAGPAAPLAPIQEGPAGVPGDSKNKDSKAKPKKGFAKFWHDVATFFKGVWKAIVKFFKGIIDSIINKPKIPSDKAGHLGSANLGTSTEVSQHSGVGDRKDEEPSQDAGAAPKSK